MTSSMTSCKLDISHKAPNCKAKQDEHKDSIEDSIGVALFNFLKLYSKRVLQYLADTDETDTYEQVLARSVRTALKLRDEGVQANDIVSTCTFNHKNSCVPLLATFFLGDIPANFDPNLSHLDTAHLLKLMRPKVMFVSSESVPFMERCLADAKTDTKLVVFGKSDKYQQFDDYLSPHPLERTFKPVGANWTETAVILFSSGTTGLPKGICLSHRTLLTNIQNFLLFAFGDEESEQNVTLTFTTLYWISGLAFLLDAIVRGNAKVVCSKFDPYETWHIIEKYKVSTVFMAPHMASDLLRNRPKDADVSCLKLFFTGSTPVTAKLMADLDAALPDAKVINGYGQTEAASVICRFDTQNPAEMELQRRKPLSCGKIMPQYQWKIVDLETEEVLGPNERGELRIKSDLFMNGYYKMDSSSAFDSEGYLKTGDVAYYDEEDCFFVVDRIKEMFKYKGWHVLPVIVEGVLASHPAVKEAAVVGVPHDTDGDHPLGVVVLQDHHGDVSAEEIERFVEKRVSDSQRLRAGVRFVRELPRTTTGKVRRSALKKMVLDGII